MNKIDWENSPSTNTPLSADNLNRMQDYIEDAIEIKITTGQEFFANQYIDDKKVYCKRIDIGSLPNNSQKTVNHGLNLNEVTIVKPIQGSAKNPTYNLIYPLPFSWTDPIENVGIMLEGNSINIKTASNKSGFTISFVDIYYTKNNE